MTLLQSLAELATDIARAAADQRLEVAEIVEIAGDLRTLVRELGDTEDPAPSSQPGDVPSMRWPSEIPTGSSEE
mgnify:CR=1 FL=1